VDLPAVLARLGELAINEVLAECGPRLAGALLAAGLVDELVCYLAPKILGSGARSAFALADFAVLEQCPGLDIIETRRVGSDLRIVARPASA